MRETKTFPPLLSLVYLKLQVSSFIKPILKKKLGYHSRIRSQSLSENQHEKIVSTMANAFIYLTNILLAAFVHCCFEDQFVYSTCDGSRLEFSIRKDEEK